MTPEQEQRRNELLDAVERWVRAIVQTTTVDASIEDRANLMYAREVLVGLIDALDQEGD